MKKQTGVVGILAVKDVENTSRLLTKLFNWQSTHGGSHFDILITESGTPALMLHTFDAHDHKRFAGISRKSKGVGLSHYVFVSNIESVYRKVKRRSLSIVEPLWQNPNSQAREFTFKIEEGYQFTSCENDNWLY